MIQMDDLISRQAARKALAGLVPFAIYDESTASYTNGLADADRVICQLRPEKRWIPCSERLPITKDDYIITVKDKYGTWTDYVEWSADCHWWGYDDDMVVAWMPLPEPYKGEKP